MVIALALAALAANAGVLQCRAPHAREWVSYETETLRDLTVLEVDGKCFLRVFPACLDDPRNRPEAVPLSCAEHPAGTRVSASVTHCVYSMGWSPRCRSEIGRVEVVRDE